MSDRSYEEIKRDLEIDDLTLRRFLEIREDTIGEAKRISEKTGRIKALGISGSARDKYDMAAQSSNSEYLLTECLIELNKLGAETELIPLRKYDIKPCKACYSTTNAQCHFPCSCYPRGTEAADDMSNILYDKLMDADIIIFATPVNNFKISSYMALFLDRLISMDGSLSPADPSEPKNVELNIKHTKFIETMADESIPGSGFLKRFSGKVAGIIVTGHEEGAALAISSLFMTLNHYGMVFPPWSNIYAVSSILNHTYKDKQIVNGPDFLEDAKRVARNTFIAAKSLRDVDKYAWQYNPSTN